MVRHDRLPKQSLLSSAGEGEKELSKLDGYASKKKTTFFKGQNAWSQCVLNSEGPLPCVLYLEGTLSA